MATRIIDRMDTAANWTTANPILSENEKGVESNTGLFKYGDGLQNWNDLEYFKPLLPVPLPVYTVVGVPDAEDYTNSWIMVSNETGGAVMAFSDGTNWRRSTDRNIIS